MVDQIFHIATLRNPTEFKPLWERQLVGMGIIVQSAPLKSTGEITAQSYSFYADMFPPQKAHAWLVERDLRYIHFSTAPIRLGEPHLVELADSQNCDPIEIRPVNIDHHDGATQ